MQSRKTSEKSWHQSTRRMMRYDPCQMAREMRATVTTWWPNIMK
jgi:hypothetical protein